MSHFVEINDINEVIRVVVLEDKDTQDSDGNEDDLVGIKYLNDAFGGTWLRTSYNMVNGVHQKDGTPFRKNYAGIGYTYDETRDAFIPPKTLDSFILNESTCVWDPPVPRPDGSYLWNEANQTWDPMPDPGE